MIGLVARALRVLDAVASGLAVILVLAVVIATVATSLYGVSGEAISDAGPLWLGVTFTGAAVTTWRYAASNGRFLRSSRPGAGPVASRIRAIADHQLAASRSKDPALCVEVAYRTAYERAVLSGDFGSDVLARELKAWPIPGAYDTPDVGRLDFAYRAWAQRTDPQDFRAWVFDQPRRQMRARWARPPV